MRLLKRKSGADKQEQGDGKKSFGVATAEVSRTHRMNSIS